MQRFDAGRLGAGAGQPAREVTFYQTVHGPVSGTVTVHGRPYAVALDRSTRGDEPGGELAISDLDSDRVHNPAEFFRAVNQFGTTFNWPYIDSRQIAYSPRASCRSWRPAPTRAFRRWEPASTTGAAGSG
jgi:Penicillin amidase